jgi:hypothetical protein
MRQYANAGVSTLASAITSSATALSVATGHGARFDPSPSGVALSAADPLALTLCADGADQNYEVVYVIAPRSGDTFPTIIRNRENTTPRDWPAGTLVRAGITGGALAEYSDALSLFGLLANPVQCYIPTGGGANTAAINIGFGGTDGTVAGRSVATTNILTRQQRIGLTSAATAGSSLAIRGTATTLLRGDGAGNGGFRHVSRWGINDAAAVADARLFAGVLTQVVIIANQNPSVVTNMIGVGADAGETTLSLMHNDGSGTATKVSLGANFPCDTRGVDWYELEISSRGSSTSVVVTLRRLNTGHVSVSTITTDMPATSTPLTSQIWRNNGATALAVSMDIGGVVHGPRL